MNQLSKFNKFLHSITLLLLGTLSIYFLSIGLGKLLGILNIFIIFGIPWFYFSDLLWWGKLGLNELPTSVAILFRIFFAIAGIAGLYSLIQLRKNTIYFYIWYAILFLFLIYVVANMIASSNIYYLIEVFLLAVILSMLIFLKKRL